MAIEKRIGAYSAYAIAVKSGFAGTEEEWLESLIGPRGYQGWGVSAVNVSADGSLIFTVKNPETGETRELEPIQIETLNALNSISTAKDEAVNEVKKAQTQATEAVDTAGNQALQDISDAKTSATGAVNTAGENAVNSVNSAGQAAIENAQTAIASAKNQAVSGVESAGQSAVEKVQEAQTSAEQAVDTAKNSAVQAVENAGTEETEKISGILPVPTEADNGKVLTVVDGKWTALEPSITNWERVQLIVRAGLAPRYFPVGYEFITHGSTEDTDITWRVVGHDTIKAADEALTHSMVLETKYVYSNSTGSYISMQFDAPETLYYAETGLEVGTYNFTLLANYDINYGGGKTYSFTLTQPVPAGGVIMFPWGYNQQASEVKISTYATQADTAAIETVPVTEGSEGTSLGTADGKTENMNHTHRIRYGSNNYAQSAIKQWLNSKEAAGSVWAPQTVFDRPPNWASNRTGFLAGLPEDFLSVVQAANVPCRTNSIFEVDSLDGTEFAINQIYNLEEKFFLLSRPEIYGTWDNSDYKDGEQLDFYKGLTDAERIKYDPSGSARSCWLRSPYPGNASYVRFVHTSGALYNDSASAALAAAPACIIA